MSTGFQKDTFENVKSCAESSKERKMWSCYDDTGQFGQIKDFLFSVMSQNNLIKWALFLFVQNIMNIRVEKFVFHS